MIIDIFTMLTRRQLMSMYNYSVDVEPADHLPTHRGTKGQQSMCPPGSL